jgi:eukaryotic-like serine/threonine-protein kinase
MSSHAKPPPTPQDVERLRAAETEVPQTLSLELSSETWDALEICLEKFNEAWRSSTSSPPSIKQFVPDRAGLRQVAIVELIKLDMEHRQNNHLHHATLEDYAGKFPELGGLDRMPVELIYEEFLVRRQTDTALRIDDYERRFPRRAAELRALAAVHDAPANEARKSTSITSLRRPEALQVGDKVDDFDLLAMLGQGSFAKVFLARQVSLQRLVALKISAARGFESQTLAQLDHPNIVRVYDQRRIPERNLQLLYMQYMPGGTLSEVVQRVKRTPPATRTSEILLEVVKESLNKQGEGVSEITLPNAIRGASWWKTVTWLGMNLAAALDHAHNRGVLHRDLKPANVLLGRDGNPRLADFNVSACSVVASHVSAAYFGGSLAYMSPEQLEAFGAPPEQREAMMDGRSDVFSLGILLWEVLTGTRPYRDEQISDLEADTLLALAKRRRVGPSADDWRALAAEAPSGLVAFFRKCLAAKPEDRFPSALAARRELTLCANDASSKLLNPQSQGRFQRFCRNYPIVPLILTGLVPNIVASGLNIPFNFELIVHRLQERAGSDVERRAVGIAFNWAMLYINSVAYIVGFVSATAYFVPVALAAAKAHAGKETHLKYRYRSIWMPIVVALVTASLWLISGPIFPIVLGARGAPLHVADYLHFIFSQAICGTLAASLAFNFTAVLCLRYVIPQLLDAKQDDPKMHGSLYALSQWATIFEFATYAVGPGAAILFGIARTSDSQIAFLIFSAAGFLCLPLIFWIKRGIIDRNIAALQSTTMIEENMGGDTQSSLAVSSRRAAK